MKWEFSAVLIVFMMAKILTKQIFCKELPTFINPQFF